MIYSYVPYLVGERARLDCYCGGIGFDRSQCGSRARMGCTTYFVVRDVVGQ